MAAWGFSEQQLITLKRVKPANRQTMHMFHSVMESISGRRALMCNAVFQEGQRQYFLVWERRQIKEKENPQKHKKKSSLNKMLLLDRDGTPSNEGIGEC